MSRTLVELERFLKSFVFSLMLFCVWGWLSFTHARSLRTRFELLECLWLIYNATIALLFLVRTRPSIISLNLWHWIVALVTSFAGLFFEKSTASSSFDTIVLANAVVAVGLALGILSAIALGRSYDFVPALRHVQTGWVYHLVRHPMYLSSILIRLGYLLHHRSWYNLAVFVVMVWLYDRRACFEEQTLKADPKYAAYLERVKFRFVPCVY